ncbi:MAG: AzlC family ABC transporter permease [Mailhella sp.]|nr:AzlC family ABC transporter permease [Mailhella sp.]
MAEAQNDSPRSGAASALAGAKLGLPIMLGYLPLGFAYGVLAVKSGIPPFWAILMSTVVFAGAGQFIVAGMLGAGASVLSSVIANFMVNMRHILMSAALAPHMKPFARWARTVLSLFQTDEIFALTIHLFKSGDAPGALKLFCLAVTAQSGWIIGTAAGAFSGGMVADVKPLGLDFALTAMFIALLIPMCFDRIQLIAALSGIVFSLAFNMLGFGRWSVIMATICAATIGLFLSLHKDRSCAVQRREP